ncbi:hypothetical protein C2G38_2045051 [Gigaspora rosea]|uniref:UBA domain-containing protein n=1 Tax=Gigaspora rosea TaxID=44941 RepID=A0A397UMJ2_9GLOM|nr:hypothetical protein C2G38_2045051 [Gigaspora rosea]CAG8743065.1 15362_t:CDS:2 [Gigaspora rosea]
MEHQNTISSIYSALENVPLILAPQYSALQPVTMPHDFTLDLPPVNKYDFNLERHIIADSERFRLENAALIQMRAQKLQALQDARIRKQKEEARKIAPGFLDTDRRLLTPVPMHAPPKRASQQIENGNSAPIGSEVSNGNQKVLHGRSASDELPNHVVERMKLKEEGDVEESKPAKSLVYLEFEESLPSRNPSDPPNTIQNDIAILQGVIGPSVSSKSQNEVKNVVSNGLAMSPTTIGLHMGPEVSLAPSTNFNMFHISPRLQPAMPPPQQQPQPFTLGSSLPNHSNPEQFISTNLANMRISPPNTANVYTSPLSSMSARNISAPNLQGEMQRIYTSPSYPYERRPSHQSHIIPPTLPTRPPKEALSSSPSTSHIEEESDIDENDTNSEMIKQFINMGFSKTQAINALEKFDYDPYKATNYLLDLQ